MFSKFSFFYLSTYIDESKIDRIMLIIGNYSDVITKIYLQNTFIKIFLKWS